VTYAGRRLTAWRELSAHYQNKTSHRHIEQETGTITFRAAFPAISGLEFWADHRMLQDGRDGLMHRFLIGSLYNCNLSAILIPAD
jgi:hypothetical protein